MARRQEAVRRSAAEWARHVAAWQHSGSSARTYAARHGMKVSTLKWWTWKLGSDQVSQIGQALLPVEMAEDGPTGRPSLDGGWELLTVDGHCLRGGADLTPKLARALIGAVMGSR